MVHVNSTRYGGGVAEMLHRLLPLFEELGVKVRWEVMSGSDLFYRVTKSFHNALQGTKQRITSEMYDAFIECNRDNAKRLNLDAEFAMIHDPQPAALIDARPHGATWTWRCHIDVSTPQHSVWQFLRPFVVRYDAAVFSLPKLSQRLPLPQFLVYPSIDPFSEKIASWGLTRSTGYFNDWVCLGINRSCCKCYGSIGSRIQSAWWRLTDRSKEAMTAAWCWPGGRPRTIRKVRRC